LGRNTAFTEENDSHKITIPDERFGNVDLDLHTSHEDKVTNYGLKGRATNVFPVTSKVLADAFPDAKEDGMVAKIFWAEEQRTSEPDILKKVEEIASSNANVKDHIPDLFWYYKFDEPTSEIRKLLGSPEPKKGSRALYILVFRKLRPITELYGKDFFNVWQQCILCTWFVISEFLSAEMAHIAGHFDLWQGGVYHRDVSSPNLMWRKDKEGNLLGVLNDYDLSSLRITQGPQGNERTGTVPFMALELLTKEGQRGEVKHSYRHDLESFMWVLPWVCLRYKNGNLRTSDRPLDEWATKDAQTVCEKKLFFLHNFWTFKPRGVDRRIWSLLFACLSELREQANRRAVVMGYMAELTEETEESGEDSMESDEELTESSEESSESDEIPAEDVEVADDVLLRKFTKTKAWVKLQKSLRPRNKRRS
jgi:serine/threonine protein kinase